MMATPARTMSLYTATCLVVANMVGTGVFTSVGYQVAAGLSPFVILVLWLVGGVCAFCGGVSYAELASALPRSGGEYHFLTRIYHPAVGFLAGWTSITVGFSAPVALTAMAFGSYLHGVIPGVSPQLLAVLSITLVTVMMVVSPRARVWFQNGATSLKVMLLLLVAIAGWVVTGSGSSLAPQAGDLAQLTTPAFATSLAWVMYSYMGWNASVYVAGEVRNPTRNVPMSMAIGTVLVTVLYLLVNGAFLRLAPTEALLGKKEAGLVAAQAGFGDAGAMAIASLISLGLLASIGAMQWVGPRVMATMGEDHQVLRPLTQTDRQGLPLLATLTQTAIVAFLLITGTFQSVLNYVLFTLSLCSFLTVLGVFVLRFQEPDLPRPVKAWGFPVTPLIYLAVNGWMLAHILKMYPRESSWGFATLLTGLIVFQISDRMRK
jgi:basic amino acid/polyamine antiporter, APA family